MAVSDRATDLAQLMEGYMKNSKPIKKTCRHIWLPWVIVGYTGDWFHPHIMKRACSVCGTTETEDQ